MHFAASYLQIPSKLGKKMCKQRSIKTEMSRRKCQVCISGFNCSVYIIEEILWKEALPSGTESYYFVLAYNFFGGK